jgi:hypothetical protein
MIRRLLLLLLVSLSAQAKLPPIPKGLPPIPKELPVVELSLQQEGDVITGERAFGDPKTGRTWVIDLEGKVKAYKKGEPWKSTAPAKRLREHLRK